MSNPAPTIPPLAVAVGSLLGCLCTELETTMGGPVCWCGLWHGDPVAWDYCDGCEGGRCGMAYVRVDGVFPYDTFPNPALDQTCRKPIAYAIEVGVMRCFPIMEEDGSLPTDDEITEAVIVTYDDIEAMRRALLCCDAEVWLDTYTPLNEGGCAGGSWTAFLTLEP